jgi:outer membrane protein
LENTPRERRGSVSPFTIWSHFRFHRRSVPFGTGTAIGTAKQRSAFAVRKLSICLSAAAALTAAGALHVAWGQGSTAPKPPVAHKVGLIDMAHLFNKYKKFENLREDLRGEIEEKDEELKQSVTQIRQIQEEMKQFNPESKDFVQREEKIAQLSARAQTNKNALQRKFFQDEARMYRTVYLEVSELVKKYAEYNKYTLILRFTSDELGDNDDPQKVMAALQRQVVYYRPEDDITNEVLDYLNKKYESSVGGQAQAPRQPAGNGATKPRTAKANTDKPNRN